VTPHASASPAWLTVARSWLAGGRTRLLALGRDRVTQQWRSREPVASNERQPGSNTRDLRLVPLAGSGWAAAWLGTWGTPGGWAVAAVAALVAALLGYLRRSSWLVAVALVIALLGVVGGAQAYRLTTGPLAAVARQEAVVTGRLELRTDLQLTPARGVRPGYGTAKAQVRQVEGRTGSWRLSAPVLLVVTGDALTTWAWPVGGVAEVSARVQAPELGSDVAAVLRIRDAPVLLTPPPVPLRLVERVRQGLRTAVAHRSLEPRALVPALVLGDTSGMTDALDADFRATGLTHLTAVSGANLTLLLAFVLTAARWLGVRGWWLRLAGLLGVIVFVALCRSEPSVLRAAAMGLVALAALGSGGRRAGLRHLSLAMLILLLLDPYLGRSVGFALSVLASAGIIWWARPWALILNRWLPMVIAESVAVPLAANLSTLPLVAAISGRVSASGLVANAAAGPFVGPATVFGFGAAGLSLISRPGAALLGLGAAASAQLIIWVAHLGARLPGSTWQWPTTPAALAWLSVAALATGLVMGFVLARPWLSILLGLMLVVGLAGPPAQPGWPPAGWVLVACDVGQGDGLVLRTGDRAAVVVDTGPDPPAMRRCLDQLRVATVPLVVLTHFHADHVDGLPAVLAGRQVGQIWTSPLRTPAYEAAAVDQEARQDRAPVSSPPVGTEVRIGPATLLVLGPVPHPLAGGEDDSSTQNDESLVVMVTVDGFRLLLTGDVEPPGQQAILATGADLRADVLKVPHHGSARQDPGFFAATHARLAIASVGVDNDYGHPAPRTVQLVASLGMTLMRTDQEGAVAVTVLDGRIGAVTQRR
jgi:competence protein ComEC